MFTPKFISIPGPSVTVPYAGLSMREIYSRFCATGEYLGYTRPGIIVEDMENASNSEADPDEKWLQAQIVPDVEAETPEASPDGEADLGGAEV